MKICDSPVMAGIVLYNPDIKLLERDIDSVYNQVDKIFLYDNASENHDEIYKMLKKYPKAVYKRGEKNEGIAKGLNEILSFADKNGYEWYLTLDQDSVCAANLMKEYRKFMLLPKVALICPVILNNGKLTVKQARKMYKTDYDYLSDPVYCITSACLNNTKAVKKVGGYTEKLFIDYVDTELNCRIFLHHYKIVRANKTYLFQKMGKAKRVWLFTWLYNITHLNIFRMMQTASVYSDLRLYYISRNSRILRRTYKNPGKRVTFIYIFSLFCYFTLTYPKDRSRISMWKSIIKGFLDGKMRIRL